MAKPTLKTGELPTDARSTLERIESCAGQELGHYPKRTDEMTADEQAIVRVAADAVGRLLFCEGQARDALRALKRGQARKQPGQGWADDWRKTLEFLAGRLIHVYGESPNTDYLMRALEMAKAELDPAGLLAKYGTHLDGCNSVEAWGPEEHECDCGLAEAIGPAGRPRVYDTQDDIDLLLERSVVELDLALESRKALERGGFRTLGDLCRAEVSDVAAAFGETSVEEFLTRMDGLGLRVGVMPTPVNPDCAVCGHRSKYHGAGSCHQCSCEGQFTRPGIEVLPGDEGGDDV